MQANDAVLVTSQATDSYVYNLLLSDVWENRWARNLRTGAEPVLDTPWLLALVAARFLGL